MNNNSSKSRFAKITAKVIVMLLAVVLSLSVLPALSADILPVVDAADADVSYVVQAGTAPATINSQLASYPDGYVINVVLSGDIVLRNDSVNHKSGIVIPAGKTVNLYLNSYNIVYTATRDVYGSELQFTGIYGIVNNGTLNVYSGSETAPNRTMEANKSTISVTNIRNDMKSSTTNEYAYGRAEAIQNHGTLTVNRGVQLVADVQLRYVRTGTVGQYDQDGSSTVAVAGVYNASASAKATIDDAKITANAATASANADYISSHRLSVSNSYAYGVYGGQVNISGSTSINVSAATGCDKNGGANDRKDGRTTAVAYGICSSGLITVTGGDISYSTTDNNEENSLEEGSRHVYQGGICYLKNGAAPVMPDGNIYAAKNNSYTGDSSGSKTYREATVAVAEKLPYGTGDVFGAASGNLYAAPKDHEARPTNVDVGQFRDECGNYYNASQSTADGTHPTQLLRGALEGTNRVHVVYRYWVDENRSAIDTSVVSNEGFKGYSYNPLIDDTNVVNTLVNLSGVTGRNILTKTPDAAIKYVSGADSCNSYYWGLIDIAYVQPNAVFSDYSVTANAGVQFKTFEQQGATDGTTPTMNGPIYIFVDYGRIDPTSIKAKIGTSNVATTTYTGYPIKASTLGLKIVDSVIETDFTSEYNIDFTASDLIGISYSYTGTNMAGVKETSDSGQLPVNAGTYEVTLKVNESTTYDKDPKHNKNRYGFEHKFTLIIEQASILRGTLPENTELVYGQKLGDVLQLSTYNAKGIADDINVAGVFSFTNAADGSAYKAFGADQVVSITWNPTYSATPTAKNYKATTFNVVYNVKKAPLTIAPNAASVVYGETEFTTPFTVTITGLVANDTGASTKAEIENALSYMILNGSAYSPFVVGEVNVGSYYIRATFSAVPAVLSNYEYVYSYGEGVNEEGKLVVSQRPIVIRAEAAERYYSPDDNTAVVSFEVIEGRYGDDDVRILNATGTLNNNLAGERQVTGITKQTVADLVTGGAGKNYYISDVIYATGEKLYVNILKGIPTVSTPVVEEMYYQRARTLRDIELTGYTSSVEGTWRWKNADINPTVKVAQYKAEYVPHDLENYEIKEVDITLKVKATPVVISYTGSVSYGDNIPNITAYTYKADLDPSFNIEFVTTSGNITPYTTYVKGSPVVDGGYPVEIVAPNFIDVNGNYTFSTTNGVINVNPRLITFTVQNATAVYGENFVPSSTTVTVKFDESRLVGTDTIEDITATGAAPTFEYSTDFRYIDNYKVGTYYIKATPNFATSPNYAVESAQGVLTVTKAHLVIKADDITLEYGSPIPADIEDAYSVVGAKRNETAEEVVSSGSIKIDTTYEKNSPVNMEGYPITVDVTNAVFDNYTVSVQHGTITVIKATPKVVSLPTAKITHGQTLGDAVFTGGSIENDVAGKYLYDSSSTTPAYRADAYTIYTATFVPADSVNYNTVTGLYVALTVNKKPITGKLAVTGIPMVGETLKVDVTGLDPDEIGVYTLTWYYESTQIGTGAEITVDEKYELKKLTVKAVANAPYTGEVVYITTTIAPELTSVETILTESVYSNYFNLNGLNNFLGDAEYTYNAQPHYVSFQRNDASLSSAAIGEVQVKYNGSTEAPTKVGYYTVTIDIATPDDVDLTQVREVNGLTMVGDKVVYSPVANFKIGTLVITQAPYYVTVKVDDKIYDGTGSATAKVTDQYGACELTGGQKDDVSYDDEAAIYYFASSEVGTGIDVFVNNVQLKGEAAENYELLVSVENDAKANILKRTLKVKVVPVEREYEENNCYVDLSFEPVANTLAVGDEGFVYVNEAEVSGVAYNVTASGKEYVDKAGVHNVEVSGAVLTGSRAKNYDLELINLDGLTVEILKATPFYPIPSTDVLYYDSARPLNAISLGDSRWAWDSEVANEVPGAGIHSYKAIYTPDDTSNYAVVEYDVDVEILKTVVTITAANFTVVYGDIEPTYYYSVSGLTGADSIKNSVDGYVLMNCSYVAGSDVGQYDIVLTGAFESDNYDFIYKNGKVTVNKRAAYVEAIAENREYAPGNLKVNVTFSELTNLYFADGSKHVYLDGSFPIEGTIENENAGVKAVNYAMPTLAGEKAKNYELRLLNPTLTVEILKAKVSGVILPSLGTVGYGQRLNTTLFEDGDDLGLGKFSMENPTSTPNAIGTFSDVYKVVFTPFNTQNYATVSEYITLTVKASDLKIAVSLTGTAQSGKSLYAIINEIPSDALQYLYFEWYRVDTVDSDYRTGYKVASNTDVYTLTESDSGKFIVCVVKNIDGAPYNCFAETRTDTSVEEEQLTFWQRLVRWFYNIISNITQIFGKIL